MNLHRKEKQLRRRRWDPPKKAVGELLLDDKSDGDKTSATLSQAAQTESSYGRVPPAIKFQDIRCLTSDESLNGIPRDPDPASEREAAAGTGASHYSQTSAEIAATNALMALGHSSIHNLQEVIHNGLLVPRKPERYYFFHVRC
jgi:hypothetical protein